MYQSSGTVRTGMVQYHSDESLNGYVIHISQKALHWTSAAVLIPVACAVGWWIVEKSLNRLAPYEYHYRPGTISSYIASLFSSHAKRRRGRAPLRVYMDGCFDMMHYGHANALRQAAALGDQLVVGLIPDSEILRCKGPPVMDEDERRIMIDSVKWVGQVITGVPYELTPAFLDELLTKHRIDYVVHGDDPCILPDGSDAYAHVKQQGRFRMIKRTEGVSSTDIVGRMLMCTRDNARFRQEKRELTKKFSRGHEDGDRRRSESLDNDRKNEAQAANNTTLSKFMPTARRIVQFSDGVSPVPGSTIVYIDGAFDLFHPGHVQVLQAARKLGSFLIVGLHTDEDVTARRGPHLPIMDLHERSLSVLACRFANEVIIGAPLVISDDLIKTFNISIVARGTVSETGHSGNGEERRYATPKQQGILREVQSPSQMTTATIIERIVRNRENYEARNAKKSVSEAAYYKDKKQYVNEI